MAKYLTITNSKITKLGYKKRTLERQIYIGPISLKFLIIGLLSILLLIYIAQSNEASLKGYKLQELQEAKNNLLLENQRLNLEAIRLKSLESLENKKELNLVPPSKIDYLPIQGSVAVKNR